MRNKSYLFNATYLMSIMNIIQPTHEGQQQPKGSCRPPPPGRNCQAAGRARNTGTSLSLSRVADTVRSVSTPLSHLFAFCYL